MVESVRKVASHAGVENEVIDQRREGHCGVRGALWCGNRPVTNEFDEKTGRSASNPGKLPTPQKAIRLRCLDCRETWPEIAACEFGPDSHEESDPCPLWPFRMGLSRKAGKGSRLKAIRRYCLWCCCESRTEIRLCPSKDFCALWPYRFGRRPKAEDGNGREARADEALRCAAEAVGNV